MVQCSLRHRKNMYNVDLTYVDVFFFCDIRYCA